MASPAFVFTATREPTLQIIIHFDLFRFLVLMIFSSAKTVEFPASFFDGQHANGTL